MSSLDDLQARSRAYGLFSRLYRGGLTSNDLPVVCAIDALSPHVAAVFDADEAAADHYAVFGLDVFPFAGSYLDADGLTGGRAADAAYAFYEEAGLTVSASGESADHLSTELALLEYLTATEANALRNRTSPDPNPSEADRARARQLRFLKAHVFTWLPPFLEALSRQDDPFYRALGELTLDLVLDHCEALGKRHGARDAAASEGLDPEPTPRSKADTPRSAADDENETADDISADDLLDRERTGLGDIAAFLATPAKSGLCLSRGDIAAMSRSEELPRGFGSRAQTLTNLLRSSVEFGRVDELLERLRLRIRDARTFYTAVAAAGLSDEAASWLERLTATERIIDRLRETRRQPATAVRSSERSPVRTSTA